MNYSPLRYPGGKTRIAPLVKNIMNKAGIENGTYIEPFAGGCGIALSLLLNGDVQRIVINDFDKSIYSFWYSIKNFAEQFIEKIKATPVTVEEWRNQKRIFEMQGDDLFELGFATFYLNRTNRSGILKAGPIGGYSQDGNYLIDARFNKTNLIDRIYKISKFNQNIIVYNQDIRDFIINTLPNYDDNAFIYFDPPYYVKGRELYVNFFTPDDHQNIANLIKNLHMNWMVTYDNVSEIKEIYNGMEQRLFDINYSLSNKGKKSEIIVLSSALWPNKAEQKKLKITLRCTDEFN